MKSMTADGYILEDIKPPKASSIKATAKKQNIKAVDQLSGAALTWILFKRLVRFLWANRVPIAVNAFIFENAYLAAKHFGLL